MKGTNNSTRGIRRITRLNPPTEIRLFGFLLLLACGAVLLAWITHSAWQQLQRLKKEHTAVRSESFYLGVTLRSALRSINDKLMQFHASGDEVIRQECLKETTDLAAWLATNRAQVAQLRDPELIATLGLSSTNDLLAAADAEYASFLTKAAAQLDPDRSQDQNVSFKQTYLELSQSAHPLIAIANSLVKAQREAFQRFLSTTQATLERHQQLLQLTSGLILVLTVALALVVYRGMIAPLRQGLTQSQKIIERQEKLAALGVLASGVAHEVRNPLTAIKIRLFRLKRAVPGVADSEDATLIANEIARLERIVRDFLLFAKPSEPAMCRVSAGECLKEVRNLLQPQLERIGIDLLLEETELLWVHADAQQLKQVLINLVQNAAETIGLNGTVTLRTTKSSAELDHRLRPVVILSVTDTGKGIHPEVEDRLFDPFFTTKDQGTGLGLAIAARIVEKHGGLLRYETQLDQGTTFEVILPRIENHGSQHSAH